MIQPHVYSARYGKEFPLHNNHPHKGKSKSQWCSQNEKSCCKVCKEGRRRTGPCSVSACACVRVSQTEPETRLYGEDTEFSWRDVSSLFSTACLIIQQLSSKCKALKITTIYRCYWLMNTYILAQGKTILYIYANDDATALRNKKNNQASGYAPCSVTKEWWTDLAEIKEG